MIPERFGSNLTARWQHCSETPSGNRHSKGVSEQLQSNAKPQDGSTASRNFEAISEQFQSRYSAVSEEIHVIFGAILEQFQSNSGIVSKRSQSSFKTILEQSWSSFRVNSDHFRGNFGAISEQFQSNSEAI